MSIEDNFLVYGKGTKELKGIAKNVLSKIRKKAKGLRIALGFFLFVF